MIVCTYTYCDHPGIEQMKRSVEYHGHELAIVKTNHSPNDINQKLLGLYQRASGGHENFLYLDAADSFVQCHIEDIPTDHILYSTEKACYPFPAWASKHPESNSRWRFLNGGGVCGPLKLMIEYCERYKLCAVGGMNGQAYLQQKLFEAIADGFPVRLDTECRIFQTLAFADDSEFEWKDGLLHNTMTGTVPMVLHGNGLTEMKHIYERFKSTFDNKTV